MEADINLFFDKRGFIYCGCVYPKNPNIYERSVITRNLNYDIKLSMTEILKSKEEGFKFSTSSFHFRKLFPKYD